MIELKTVHMRIPASQSSFMDNVILLIQICWKYNISFWDGNDYKSRSQESNLLETKAMLNSNYFYLRKFAFCKLQAICRPCCCDYFGIAVGALLRLLWIFVFSRPHLLNILQFQWYYNSFHPWILCLLIGMHAMNAMSFKFYSLYVSPTEKIDNVKKVDELGTAGSEETRKCSCYWSCIVLRKTQYSETNLRQNHY